MHDKKKATGSEGKPEAGLRNGGLEGLTATDFVELAGLTLALSSVASRGKEIEAARFLLRSRLARGAPMPQAAVLALIELEGL